MSSGAKTDISDLMLDLARESLAEINQHLRSLYLQYRFCEMKSCSEQSMPRESPQEKTGKVSRRQSLSPAVMIDFDGRNTLRLV